MARKQRYKILPDHQILSQDEIRDTVFNKYSIFNRFEEDDRGVEWLVRHQILPNTKDCASCLARMSFVKKKQKSVPYRWRCSVCETYTTLTDESVLQGTRIEFKKTILRIYRYINNSEI